MWTFVVLMVMTRCYAHAQKTIDAHEGQNSVLLQCSCSNRDEMERVSWQRNTDAERTPVLLYTNNTPEAQGSYNGRVKILLTENKDNCSLLLLNITLTDAGTYSCHFFTRVTTNTAYNELKITLKVSGSEDKDASPVIETTTQSQGLPSAPSVQVIPSVSVTIVVLILLVSVLIYCYRSKRLARQTNERVTYDQVNSQRVTFHGSGSLCQQMWVAMDIREDGHTKAANIDSRDCTVCLKQ